MEKSNDACTVLPSMVITYWCSQQILVRSNPPLQTLPRVTVRQKCSHSFHGLSVFFSSSIEIDSLGQVQLGMVH